jgi:four helix bundle protein
MEKGYRKLLAWQRANELAREIYLATKKFPRDELYGITSQLRRSAVSVPTNIVEGAARQNKAEFKQLTNIALGSLAETEYLLEFCLELKYLSIEEFNKLESCRKNVGGLLWNLYKSLLPCDR